MELKKNRYPSKQDINLAVKEKAKIANKKLLITALVLVLAVGGFCKFAVIDRLQEATAAENAALQVEKQLAEAKNANKDFPKVQDEYRTYTLAHKAAAKGADPMECLTLIEYNLLNEACVEEFTIYNKTIAVELSGVTLEEVSMIHNSLLLSKLVESVQVYTASTSKENSDGHIQATITMQLVVDEDKEGSGS